MQTKNLQMSKLGLRKEEELEIKLPIFAGLQRKQGDFWASQVAHKKNIYLCFIKYAKAFNCVDHDKLWKALREMGIPDHLPVSCETFMQVKKQVRTLYGTTDWFEIEKGVRQGCLLSSVYLTYMLSTS